MIKKTMLLATAIGVLVALAIPAAASAQLLTSPAGTAIKVGTNITATSTNLVTTTALGKLTCAKVTIHANVTANKGSTSAVSSTSVTTESCDLLTASLVSHPATITSASASFHIEKKGVGTTTATFIADIPAVPATCHESGTPGITYTAGTDVINVKGALSGPCGAAEIHGSFTLETSNGSQVIID